ncbi:MAG: tryptophan synthase subunit alpha [Corynebacterium sp.]|nr:tryptophan synthase subunit alpha [Corynebacterium sp.]
MATPDRYQQLFDRLPDTEGAFIPFVMLGDPDAATSEAIIEALIDAGADALELGIPFSDPIADGPAIQNAHIRGLDAGSTLAGALAVVSNVRSRHPDLPIGLLVYSNMPVVKGADAFYEEVAAAGADSVLLPDVPIREHDPFSTAAQRAGILPIYIAPPRAKESTLEGVAHNSKGYVYAISRDGVTGTERAAETTGLDEVVRNIARFGGAPVVLGFGISTPQHVHDAIAAGARGAIAGSAIVNIIARHLSGEHPEPRTVRDREQLLGEVSAFVAEMKAATRQPSQ